jgi:Xaa-Pro aminopeptidase
MVPEPHASRLARVRRWLDEARADAVLVPASADFLWLTGAHARLTERMVALALPRRGDPFCVVGRLEADALQAACPWLELEAWADGAEPFDILWRRLGLVRGPSLFVGEGLRAPALLRLAAHARCRPAADALGALRAVKDADEIARLERAAAHADAIAEEAADFARPGLREREIAAFICQRFESVGDREPWAIVATGPNAALPHHFTSERALEARDVLLLDLGAFTDGYGSDMTRTFWIGDPEPEAERVYDVVNRARAAGIAAARDGAPAESVDHAARGVIDGAGYAERFTHRTGHGVGLEVHEMPYLVAGNRRPLERGMVHSVEPGIYLPGRFGVRLEDLVVVGADGGRRLNQAPLDPRPPRMRA